MGMEEYDSVIISYMGHLCDLGTICTLDEIKKKKHDNSVIVVSGLNLLMITLPFKI